MDELPEHFHGRLVRAATLAGPVAGLNPTIRYIEVEKKKQKKVSGPSTERVPEEPASSSSPPSPSPAPIPRAATEPVEEPGAYHVWRSRDNRKGRHAITLTPEYAQKVGAPPATNTLLSSVRSIGKMFIRYPVWDVSYDVATVFTWGAEPSLLHDPTMLSQLITNCILGSVVWVINGFFEWYPLQNPASEFPGEVTMGGGVTAFIGATIFEFGSVLLMLEAVNENRSECFGWALEEAVESGKLALSPSHECQHSHQNRRAWLKGQVSLATADDGEDGDEDESGGVVVKKSGRVWEWWPSWYEFRTHYFKDIGFLACLAQMLGATVFWISGFTGLPPIFNSLSVPATNGIFWLPQVSFDGFWRAEDTSSC